MHNIYEYKMDVSVKEIFSKMLDQTLSILDENKDLIEKSNYSVHEIITLASMVESEGVSLEDRKNIAGVFINRLNSNITYKLDSVTTKFNNLKTSRVLVKPEEMFIRFNNSLELTINKLELLNPLSVLSKGYGVVSSDDKIVKSVNDVKKNDKLNIKLLDGVVHTTVEGVE